MCRDVEVGSGLLSTVPRKVHFLIHLALLVLVVSGSSGDPLWVSISLMDTAHIGITAATEQGQIRRMNAHTTEVWWPTEVCDRRVVHPSSGKGRAGVYDVARERLAFPRAGSVNLELTVHCLKSPV